MNDSYLLLLKHYGSILLLVEFKFINSSNSITEIWLSTNSCLRKTRQSDIQSQSYLVVEIFIIIFRTVAAFIKQYLLSQISHLVNVDATSDISKTSCFPRIMAKVNLVVQPQVVNKSECSIFYRNSQI